MRTHPLLCAALCAGLGLGAGCKSPAERLASNAEDLNEILTEHEKSPDEGIEALLEYAHSNLPQMAEDITKILVELDQKDSSTARSEYLDKVLEELEEPAKALVKAGRAFVQAADKSEDTEKKLEELARAWGPAAELLKVLGADIEEKLDGEDPLVAGAKKHADAICKCETDRCREAAMKDFMGWAEPREKEALDRKNRRKLEPIMERLSKCMARSYEK